MMPRVRSFARLLAALALMVSWTTGGWAAACALGAVASAAEAMPQPDAAGHGMHAMAHHGMHHGMHHHAPPPAPKPKPKPKPGQPAPRGQMPACPLLVMNGGSCLGAAQLPSVVSLPAPPLADASAYPPADAIHDRLLPLSLFRPPQA
jgi:hypothetical protein